MTRSNFLDPDGVMMERYSITFDTKEEGLAFMRATPGQATPIDITVVELPLMTFAVLRTSRLRACPRLSQRR